MWGCTGRDGVGPAVPSAMHTPDTLLSPWGPGAPRSAAGAAHSPFSSVPTGIRVRPLGCGLRPDGEVLRLCWDVLGPLITEASTPYSVGSNLPATPGGPAQGRCTAQKAGGPSGECEWAPAQVPHRLSCGAVGLCARAGWGLLGVGLHSQPCAIDRSSIFINSGVSSAEPGVQAGRSQVPLPSLPSVTEGTLGWRGKSRLCGCPHLLCRCTSPKSGSGAMGVVG